jgi:hypothetical protein
MSQMMDLVLVPGFVLLFRVPSSWLAWWDDSTVHTMRWCLKCAATVFTWQLLDLHCTVHIAEVAAAFCYARALQW